MGFYLVTIYFLPLEIPVDLMQTKPMITGDIGFRLQYIPTQLVDSTGTSRIIAGHLYTTGQGAALVLETAYVIGLPAMQDRDIFFISSNALRTSTPTAA